MMSTPSSPNDVKSWTLPSWTYSSDELTALEKDRLFRRNWQLVGHLSELPKRGDYITFDGFGERIFVIRGESGALHAHFNVCKHRGAPLVDGFSGNCRGAIVCPYHGWSYALNGDVKGVPLADTFSEFDLSEFCLDSVEIEVWHSLIFVRIAGDGPRPAEFMAEVEKELVDCRIDEMVPLHQRTEREHALNWKTMLDNDFEGYHIPFVHKGLSQLFGFGFSEEKINSQVLRSIARISDKRAHTLSERFYQALLPKMEQLPEYLQRSWLYYAVLPNNTLNIYPDQMEIYSVTPISGQRMKSRGRSFAVPDSRRETSVARYLNDRINRRVGQEDVAIVNAVQVTAQPTKFIRGPLSTKELSVRAFHDFIRSQLPIVQLISAPESGTFERKNADMLTSRE